MNRDALYTLTCAALFKQAGLLDDVKSGLREAGHTLSQAFGTHSPTEAAPVFSGEQAGNLKEHLTDTLKGVGNQASGVLENVVDLTGSAAKEVASAAWNHPKAALGALLLAKLGPAAARTTAAVGKGAADALGAAGRGVSSAASTISSLLKKAPEAVPPPATQQIQEAAKNHLLPLLLGGGGAAALLGGYGLGRMTARRKEETRS